MEESLKSQRERIYRQYCSEFARKIFKTTLFRYADNGVIISEDTKFFDINDVIYIVDNEINSEVVVNWYNYNIRIDGLNDRIGTTRLQTPSIKEFYEGKHVIPESDIKELENSLEKIEKLIERVNK